MKEQGEIANMESCEPIPEKIRLQIFNHVSRNGHIYVADTKEDVLKVFGKFIDQKIPLCLTDKLQGQGVDFDREKMTLDEYRNNFGTVDLYRIAGIFKDIEIIETGDIGYNEKPIFEVYGTLGIKNTPSGKMVGELLKENVCNIGMRSFVVNKNGLGSKTFDIEKIVCFDIINTGEKNG